MVITPSRVPKYLRTEIFQTHTDGNNVLKCEIVLLRSVFMVMVKVKNNIFFQRKEFISLRAKTRVHVECI